MQTNKQQLVPALRFPEFEGEWKRVKLGNVASFKKGKGISKKDIDENGKHPCIRYGELYTHYETVIKEIKSSTNLDTDKLVLSEVNDIIIPASGETALDIATASCVLVSNVILGGDLNIVKTKNNGIFTAYYLNHNNKNRIAKLAQGSSVIHLYANQLKKLKLNLPSLPEQQKIANFLSILDKKKALLRELSQQLETFKKGLMQQLFSQQVRFLDENGEEFGDWEVKRLGEVFERVRSKNKENNQNILTISAQLGLISQLEFFNKSVSAKNVTGYYLLEKGDFAYNKSYSNGYPFGAIKKLNRYDKGVVSTLYICFRPKNKQFSSFFEQYFEGSSIEKELHKIAQEGARNHGLLNVSVVDFFELIKIPLPTLPEQKKIAACLSLLDQRIQKLQAQLEAMEEYKKGLMQQMLV